MACRCGASAAGCACVVDVADTNTVDMTATGTGDAASPRVISGQVIRSGAAGNTLVINPDGLYVPASPPVPPVAGCGIDVVGNTVSVDTAAAFSELTRSNCNDGTEIPGTTPLDPACELNGMPIYCDSAGELRTMPEKFTISDTVSINEGYNPAITALPFTTSEIALPITNPSSCYCLCGYVTFSFIPAISGAPGTVIRVDHEINRDNGAGFTGLTGFTMDNRGKTATSNRTERPAAPLQVCLDPGETKTLRHRVRISRDPADNGGLVQISGLAREIRYVGSNL